MTPCRIIPARDEVPSVRALAETSTDAHSNLNVAEIVGIVFGFLLAIALLLAYPVWRYIKKRRNAQRSWSFAERGQKIYDQYMLGRSSAARPRRAQTETPRESLLTHAAEISGAPGNLSEEPGTPSPLAGQKFPAVNSYIATQPDELTVEPGNLLSIEREFDDGWCLGQEHTTGKRGMFPKVCILNLAE
ncbi:hypothetical protein HK104_009997 [Borealophlyctis nickersoniae]|nr:hypothetical protein HK104_009997 [Borealophlyctis nickersoniae]